MGVTIGGWGNKDPGSSCCWPWTTPPALCLTLCSARRRVRPDELFVDTAYGSGSNAFEASRRGTELVSPVAGSAPGYSHEGERDGPPPLTAADFQIDVTGEQATVCPAGHPSIEEYELEDAPERVEVHFARTTCEPCPLRSRCPVKLDRRAGAYVLKADLVKVNIERRRRAEATEEWRKRYAIRAGIEGTNSELKRAHGLGRLRVRGGRRVRLAVYLKALACNFKRMVHARLVEMETTARWQRRIRWVDGSVSQGARRSRADKTIGSLAKPGFDGVGGARLSATGASGSTEWQIDLVPNWQPNG